MVDIFRRKGLREDVTAMAATGKNTKKSGSLLNRGATTCLNPIIEEESSTLVTGEAREPRPRVLEGIRIFVFGVEDPLLHFRQCKFDRHNAQAFTKEFQPLLPAAFRCRFKDFFDSSHGNQFTPPRQDLTHNKPRPRFPTNHELPTTCPLHAPPDLAPHPALPTSARAPRSLLRPSS